MNFDQDDRTDEQRSTHMWAVAMTDRFLSGWGAASGRASVAAWACHLDDIHRVERWVRSRSDAKRIRVVKLDGWRPRGAHVHVYVVDDGHPALA